MKTIKILGLAFSGITILITLVFFSWWAMKDRLVFGDEKFDQMRWITVTATPENRCHRGDMAFDLKEHVLAPGMARSAATVLLGRPSWEEPNQIEYDLGHCLWDTHGLRLYFDAQDRLIHSRIVQH
ncbi:MAG TPA: hypothetical protein VFF74_04170 [Methylophilaceae bacterium]|nr:hypothetical protein [Methylophilaceae bacterium]